MPPRRRGKTAARPAQDPPPPPAESGAQRVRREWSDFVDAWYDPQKKKLVEKLQNDLLVKYKSLGSAKDTLKLREMELFERLDAIAQQLALPARAEWERRLGVAHLREDQWDDMSGEEQQQVMSVFVGFFVDDDVEDMHNAILDDPPHRPAAPSSSRPAVPPTPPRTGFECVHPTSFTDVFTPPHPARNLPALSMDHLTTLGPSNPARSAEPLSGGTSVTLGFQNWASEAGILTQHPQGPSAKPPSHTLALSARPRATDTMSRQPSAASNLSSPPLKPSSPQYSPPIQSTKFSPPINAESLPPGKRYIGPVITEEDPDPLDEDLFKSKMADEYQQYKVGLRIQMIYQFHAEAADIEIKLFESLLADEGTKESRARAVQEHESSMMRLREQKEEERKRLCAEERERRREEIRQHLAQRRFVQNPDVDPPPKAAPPPTLAQHRPRKDTHQKENIPLPQISPSVTKKPSSALSQDDVSANVALFTNAMMTAQGKIGTIGLTPAQASLNEALFTNAAAMLAAQPPPESSGKSSLQPPSVMKMSNSAHSPEHDVPHVTVNFAEPPIVNPEPAQMLPTVTKGKKGKKGQPVVQPPLTKPVTVAEGPEIEAEPPPAPFLSDTAAKNSGAASTSESKFTAPAEEDGDANQLFMPARASSKGHVNAKKAAPVTKKGKEVTMAEEPDVDADPVISPLPTSKAKATKAGWGSVNGMSKVTGPVVEESELEPTAPPPLVTPAWGKKGPQVNATPKASVKPQLKMTIREEPESKFEPNPAPARTGKDKAKLAWTAPAVSPSANSGIQPGKKTTQQTAEPRCGATNSRSARVESVPDPEDEFPETPGGGDTMPGGLELAGPAEAGEEDGTSTWFNPENMSYWASFMAGPPEAETKDVPEATGEAGKHARWTPTVNGDSDEEDEFGEADEALATSMWMQYAISGGDMSALGDAPGEPRATPSDGARETTTSIWEPGKGKKLNLTTAGDSGNRAQQTAVFDRAALAGRWPKMDSWLSPPSRGQTPGSTRVF